MQITFLIEKKRKKKVKKAREQELYFPGDNSLCQY